MVDVKRDDPAIMLSRIQETDSYLACLCSVIGHRWCQIVVIKKIVDGASRALGSAIGATYFWDC